MPYLPTATYRLQFHAGFTFADAEAIVPYLQALGISDVYASPFLKANPGSTHGYDICDHSRLNPEIGDEAAFRSWTDALARHGMGLIVDIVPNHMGLNPETNRWWRSVLAHGPSSPYADYFDIDWHPLTPELEHRVLLPLLQDAYGQVLERGEIRVAVEGHEFVVHVADRSLPIDPGTLAPLLRDARSTLDAKHSAAAPLSSLIALVEGLPRASLREPVARMLRQRDSEAIATTLTSLTERWPDARRAIDAALTRLNGTAGQPRSFDRLHALLDAQSYRLAYWRTAADEINYRRFFDVNDLGGLCVEHPPVFNDAHRLVLRFIAEGRITGIRVDHPDGLYDPAAYFNRLQTAAASYLPEAHRSRHGDDPVGALYVVAEKILTDDERLPGDWRVEGTSGYGFMNVVNGVFVDGRNEARLKRLSERIGGQPRDFDEVAYHARRLIMSSSMASELNVLAEALRRIAAADRMTRDFTLNAVRRTLLETVACFPVYRSYVNARGFSAFDRDVIDSATDRARRRNPAMASALFLFLRGVLLAVPEQAPSGEARDEWLQLRRHFAMKFQQFTSPVRAKGIEDTAFYRYPVLLSLNEVGGDPSRFGHSLEHFHAGNRVRLERWPLEMNATSTHDTKRGEDARSRLNVISERPGQWQRQVFTWMRLNARAKTRVDGAMAPDRNDEYLYYQSLLGAYPMEALAPGATAQEAPPGFIDRMRQFMHKAIKEAKRHTSWVSANAPYEEAVSRFVESTLSGKNGRVFLEQFVPFAASVARLGVVNSLAQLTLKIASPGVADFYQGSELWNLSLADPDNRGAVDFARRRAILEELQPHLQRVGAWIGRAGGDTSLADDTLEPLMAEWLEQWRDGRLKLFITACGLQLRRAWPALLLHGDYQPLAASGPHGANVVAFSRERDGRSMVAVVPRLMAADHGDGLPVGCPAWGDTVLSLPVSSRGWRNLLTGAVVTPADDGSTTRVAELLRSCPVALLWRA